MPKFKIQMRQFESFSNNVYAQVVHCKLHFEHVAKMDPTAIFTLLRWRCLGGNGCCCCRPGAAVSRCIFLYSGCIDRILSLKVRLNIIIHSRSRRRGRTWKVIRKLVKNLWETTKLPKATIITSCRVWILRTRGSPARFRRGCGYGALDSIMRCGTRSGIARAVRGRLTGGPAGPGSTSGCVRSSSGSVISSSWHVPQGERRSGSTTVAFDLKCIEIHYCHHHRNYWIWLLLSPHAIFRYSVR